MKSVDVALAYLDSGLSVIPIRPDGTKGPALKEWKPYELQLPTQAEVRQWFAHCEGFAVVCGPVSGGLECLDFDEPEALAPWRDTLEGEAPDLFERLPLVRTPRDGFHLWYRCEDIDGSRKLAQKPITKPDGKPGAKTMIETRGAGGYALVPPTTGRYHELGKPYVLVRGDLTQIPTIAPDERMLMHQIAMAMNRYKPQAPEPKPPRERRQRGQDEAETEDDKPIGEWFAENFDWDQILKGWTEIGSRGSITYWRRPDKNKGISATTGWDGHDDLFYVFTTSAAPFEGGRGYTKFTAFVYAQFGGDWRRAADYVYNYRRKLEGTGVI